MMYMSCEHCKCVLALSKFYVLAPNMNTVGNNNSQLPHTLLYSAKCNIF